MTAGGREIEDLCHLVVIHDHLPVSFVDRLISGAEGLRIIVDLILDAVIDMGAIAFAAVGHDLTPGIGSGADGLAF